jgi:hypothetical protein
VQGEESAAAKAGALLEAFAAQDSDTQQTDRTEVMHVGGGWYVILIQGVPVDRVRGQEDADVRYQEILAFN